MCSHTHSRAGRPAHLARRLEERELGAEGGRPAFAPDQAHLIRLWLQLPRQSPLPLFVTLKQMHLCRHALFRQRGLCCCHCAQQSVSKRLHVETGSTWPSEPPATNVSSPRNAMQRRGSRPCASSCREAGACMEAASAASRPLMKCSADPWLLATSCAPASAECASMCEAEI